MSFSKYLLWANQIETRSIVALKRTSESAYRNQFHDITNQTLEWLLWEKDQLDTVKYSKKIPILMPPSMDPDSKSNCAIYLTHEILQNLSSFLDCFSPTNESCTVWSRCTARGNRSKKHRKLKSKNKKSRRVKKCRSKDKNGKIVKRKCREHKKRKGNKNKKKIKKSKRKENKNRKRVGKAI